MAGIPVILFPVFHPAAALYAPANKTVLQEDFLKLRAGKRWSREAVPAMKAWMHGEDRTAQPRRPRR